MITLYHCLSARSFRPLWMLEELGLSYELRVLPFPPRVLEPAFLKINPLGTVPALFDQSSRMTESAAICQYLASSYSPEKFDVAVGEPSYPRYLNLLHFGEATLTFPQTLVLRYKYFEPIERRQPQVADDYARWFLARLRTLEEELQDREYLCAERFTAADVSVGYALLLASHLGLAERFTPLVQIYWARLQTRESFRAALDVQVTAAAEQGVSLVMAPDVR
jgi:glutathione S-transferase